VFLVEKRIPTGDKQTAGGVTAYVLIHRDKAAMNGAAGGWVRGCALGEDELVEGVDGQAAEEFGVEVGGLLGHDVAGEGDVFKLVEGDGLDEEGEVGGAGLDEGHGFGGVAEVADVTGGFDFIGAEAEQVVEEDSVEFGDLELALFGGDLGEEGGDGFGFGGEEVVAGGVPAGGS